MARKVCDVNWKVTGSHKTWPENSPNIIWANKQSSAADNFQMPDSWGRNPSKLLDFYFKVLSYAGMTAAAHRITDVFSLLTGLTVWLKQSNLMDWNSIRQWFGHTCAERYRGLGLTQRRLLSTFSSGWLADSQKMSQLGDKFYICRKTGFSTCLPFKAKRVRSPPPTWMGWGEAKVLSQQTTPTILAYLLQPPITFQTALLKCHLRM